MRSASPPALASLCDRLRAQLADLKMPGALEAVDAILQQVMAASPPDPRRWSRFSRLPARKTLAAFDFSFQPTVKRKHVESPHRSGFLERRENVILLGPPGVGTTQLAPSLAVAAVESGRRVYYTTLADRITSLKDARQAGHLAQRMLPFSCLMIIDEIGYLPISRVGAMRFFPVIDRLLHHCRIGNMRGDSYRLRKLAERRSALRQQPTPPPAKPRWKETTAP